MNFSIIIPHYKNEIYLKKCLESVKSQSYKDFECIMVDDCSPGLDIEYLKNLDSSEAKEFLNLIPKNLKQSQQSKFIFDLVCHKDNRFKFIKNSKNMGQGHAQNLALQNCTKEKLVILDADDYLDLDFLKQAKHFIKNNPNQICFSSVKVFKEQQILNYKTIAKHYPTKNNLKSMLVFPNYTMTPFNYFWDLDIIRKYNIIFRYDITAQDTCFVYENLLALYKENPNLVKQDFKQIDSCYFYRIHPTQATKNVSENLTFYYINDFIQNKLKDFSEVGLKYNLLAKLMIFRFKVYQIRNDSSFFLKSFLTIIIKPVSLLAKIISLV